MSTESVRRRLEAATPGPWEWATDEGAPVYVQLYATEESDVTEYEADILSSDERGVLISEANADHIATWTPIRASLALAVIEADQRVDAAQRAMRTALVEGATDTELDQPRMQLRQAEHDRWAALDAWEAGE